MKANRLIGGLIFALCAGTGIYALMKTHPDASKPGDEKGDVPSVVSVQVGALKRMTLHNYVEGYGTVEATPATPNQPAASAPLAPPTAGVVAKVDVVEGQQVKAGDVLMELNSGAVTADYAKQEAARQKELYTQQNTSLKNLQNAEAQLAALRVVAPLSGTLTRLNVKAGQAVDVNSIVAELVDLNRLSVKADIPATDVTAVQVGDEVQVQTQPPVTATVSFISPPVNTNNSTVAVWVALSADNNLRLGQFVPLRVVTATHTNCLAAPEASVVTDISGKSVLSLVQGDEAVQTSVQTGFREKGWVEVTGSGLKEGDSVVTVGAYGLPEKTKIRIVQTGQPE